MPDYREIIKRPIDLLTMKLKLECDEYITAQQFADDLALMLDNCETYNQVTVGWGEGRCFPGTVWGAKRGGRWGGTKLSPVKRRDIVLNFSVCPSVCLSVCPSGNI